MTILKTVAASSFALFWITLLVPVQGQQSSSASAKAQEPSLTSDDIAANITARDIELLRKNLRQEKRNIIEANLPLTEAEAAKFWPVYGAYTEETIKVNDMRYSVVKDYGLNYITMTDQQASSYMRRWFDADQAALKLRLAWIPKFEAVLGEKKAAMFFQIDRRVTLVQELQLSSQLPLVLP